MAKPKEPSYPSHFSKVTVCRYVSGIHSAVADPDLQIIGGGGGGGGWSQIIFLALRASVWS